MSCSDCDFDRATDRQFNADKAASELKAYRKGRLGPTTRHLRDDIVDAELNKGTLLDIGGGIGPLTFELLNRGMSSAIIADASATYAAAATEESGLRGVTGRARIVHGDFLGLAATLPSADLVTLDRVVCCYPDYGPMLEQALNHAKCGIALSYPRDRWYVRAAMWFDNFKRTRRSGFRTFVHPPRRIQKIIETGGFRLVRRRLTIQWSIDVYARRALE